MTNDRETAAAAVVFLANDRGNQENLIDHSSPVAARQNWTTFARDK